MSHFYPYILSCYLLLTGCVIDIALPGEGDDPAPVPVPDQEKVAVSFSSTIDLETKSGGTKADAPVLADGVQVTVHAYSQGEVTTPTAAAVVSRNYVASGGNGSLTVTGDEGMMYLAVGSYTFYALSVNAETAPPALAPNSVSQTGQLENNTDYIYCGVYQAITSKPGEAQNVSLSFHRLATRLSIRIVSEGGDDKITAATAPSVLLAATNPSGVKITLGATPLITAGTMASRKEDYTTIQSEGDPVGGFTASYIMLPMQTGQTIPVTITFPSITFNGLVQTNKVYTLNITTPEDGFTSGNQYTYKVNITGNDIAFQGVSVTTWTDKAGSLPNEDVTEDW